MRRIGVAHAGADILRITVGMDHAGKEDVIITLLCVVNITMITKKGIPFFVTA